MEKVIVELSQLAARLAGGTRAIVTWVCHKNHTLKVVANTQGSGSCFEWIRQQPAVSKSHPVILLDDQSYATVVRRQVPYDASSHIKRLAAFLIKDDGQGNYALAIGNPSRAFFQDDVAVTAVEHIARVIASLLAKTPKPVVEPLPDVAQEPQAAETALQFLRDSLLVNHRILSRGDVNYLALRQWKKTIKPFQIKSMTEVKTGATPAMLDVVAVELAEACKSLYGNSFTSVVPVPGGSSGIRDGFSVQVAGCVAKHLGIACDHVLSGQAVAQGASHPKKSASLKPYDLLRPVTGNILIIDDVATSGRHLELAVQALRKTASNCTAVVWIAD